MGMFQVTSLRHHLTIHDPTDAPYKCPSCTYKTNIRMHLYDHFCRLEHAVGYAKMAKKEEMNGSIIIVEI